MCKSKNVATVEIVHAITYHINAKNIVTAHIKGKKVVMRRKDVKLGDKVVLIREDSVIPKDTKWGDFLYEWYSDGRVKHHKFRNLDSDCIALPFKAFSGSGISFKECVVGADVSKSLGITAYINPSSKRRYVRGPAGRGKTNKQLYSWGNEW
jgi:hypothetical protein